MGGTCTTCEKEKKSLENIGKETWMNETTWMSEAQLGGEY
jgi:hypothetical protein